jgi:hypothetical protein
MNLAALLLTALLGIFHHFPTRVCVVERSVRIAQAAEDAYATRHVPQGLLLSIAFHETHLGCDEGEGGNWGAPISRYRRHVAGSPDDAARILEHGFTACGSWLGSAQRFRSGLCQGTRATRSYGPNVLRLARRLYEGAGQPVPPELLTP